MGFPFTGDTEDYATGEDAFYILGLFLDGCMAVGWRSIGASVVAGMRRTA